MPCWYVCTNVALQWHLVDRFFAVSILAAAQTSWYWRWVTESPTSPKYQKHTLQPLTTQVIFVLQERRQSMRRIHIVLQYLIMFTEHFSVCHFCASSWWCLSLPCPSLLPPPKLISPIQCGCAPTGCPSSRSALPSAPWPTGSPTRCSVWPRFSGSQVPFYTGTHSNCGSVGRTGLAF